MRIAILSDTILPTPYEFGHGLGRAVANAAEQLIKRGHDVTLCGARDSYVRDARMWTTAIQNYSGEVILANEIAKHTEGFDVALDAGHMHALANLYALPTVAWFQDRASRPAPCAAFVSEDQRAHVGLEGPVIRNGIDLDQYPLGEDQRSGLVFVGTSVWHKGLRRAQDAARRAGRTLHAYGSGCPDGLIVGAAKLRAYQTATACILPYQIDAGPQVPLESMACGTPVVALARAAMPEYVPSGGGVLAETEDRLPDLIERAEAMDHKRVRAAVVANGFTVDRLGAEIEGVLMRAADGEVW